jgi:hypothetical protein
MPLALIDHLKRVRGNVEAGVIQGLLIRSRVMQLIPWANTGSLAITVTRWATLPTNAFRKFNGVYAESAGTFEQLQETVYPIGGYTDVDVMAIRDATKFSDPKADQLEMRIAAMSYTFSDYFINGSQATDPDGFTGIKNRIATLPASQSIVAATNGLDVKASTANQNIFADLLDQLLYTIDNGSGEGQLAIFGNDSSALGISSTFRRLGLLDQSRDAFGREIDAYKGVPIYDVGVKADQTTRIITNTEVTGASGSVCTSLYVVKFAPSNGNVDSGGQWLHGIQEYPMDVVDHGRLQTAPAERIEVDWPIGLAHFHKRCMGRLSGIIWT